MEKGTYNKVKVSETSVEELLPFINTFGRLTVAPHNKIVFSVADTHFNFKVLQSHDDFSLPCCKEIWVGVNEGDITFKRL